MPGLIRGVARTAVVAGTATAVSNRVSRRQGERWAAQQPQEYAPPYAAPAPAAAPPPAVAAGDTTDRIAALRQLGELRDQGVLTDAEFEAEKARILGSA
ncbi:MAG TPA: SHOCT domain-containing protein [Acidimicrobiales bacterium]